jgi:putative ABC transport system permease protein
VLSLLVVGVWPAWQLTTAEPRTALSAGGGHADTVRWRARRSLISWQVAISAGFLLIAALCIKAVVADVTHESGVDVDRLAVAVVDFRAHRWDQARAMRAVDAVIETARDEPGLEALAAATGLPFNSSISTPQASVGAAERFLGTNLEAGDNAYVITATPGIFRVLGVPMLRGRGFDARDDAAGRPVAVISEKTARSLFGTIEAVDRHMLIRGSLGTHDDVASVTVVGVSRDTDAGQLYSRRSDVVYLPLAQRYEPTVLFVGRTPGSPDALVTTLRSVIRKADPDLAVTAASSGPVFMAGLLLILRAAAVVSTVLGVVAMALSMAGLYGVLTQLVSSRTREMGIRVALGADAPRIRRLVLGDGLRPVLSGLVMGLVAGLLARAAMRALIPGSGTSLVDPLVFTLAPVPLVIAAFLACDIPARRASRVDPTVALKDL